MKRAETKNVQNILQIKRANKLDLINMNMLLFLLEVCMVDQFNYFASGSVSSILPPGWADKDSQRQVAEEEGRASHRNLQQHINTIGSIVIIQ